MSNSNFTKKAIQDAFLELLNEKPLGKITVKDISEKCGVNRNTFYYHYQDICMLLEEMCENDFDHIVEMYPELNSLEESFTFILQKSVLKLLTLLLFVKSCALPTSVLLTISSSKSSTCIMLITVILLQYFLSI